VAVLDAVGSACAVVLAPFANAPTGVMLAVAHPARVSHLVIVNGSARARRAPDYPVGIPDAVADEALRLTTDPDAMEKGYDNLAALAPSVSNDPAFRAWWDRAGKLGATPAMARAFLREQIDTDVRALLPRVTTPTLVIHRAQNPIVAVGHGRYLAEHIPNASYVELPGADTFFWVGDTREMLDSIEEFVVGTRGAPDRVLATVLFTDIVGSTDRATQLGDHRWRNLLDRHDHTVRRQIERFRGREVNTVGDGFVATFDSPGRAIECALAIRAALQPFDIATRAGIHTGEMEMRGDDIAGVAVHIGARVSALAGAGEVLVSAAVPPLVLGSRFEFETRGDHELKGLPGRWAVFAVKA
jgi:class 3 adenylate cyclase